MSREKKPGPPRDAKQRQGRSTRLHLFRSAITLIGILAAATALGLLIPAGLEPTAADDFAVAGTSPVEVELWPSEVDFGEVQAGTRATTTVKLVNKGRRPVKVQDIVTTCGCTVASTPADPIPPGDHAEIDVRMSANDKAGRRTTKTLTFLFEDSDVRLKLPVSSTSAEFIRLSSNIVDPRASSTKSLVIQSTDGRRFALESVDPPVFDVPLGTARSRHELRLNHEKWKELGSRRSVVISTRHPNVPTLTVRIGTPRTKSTTARATASNEPPPPTELQVFPQRVSFGAINPATGVSVAREVHVKGIDTEAAELSAGSSKAGFNVEVLTVQDRDDGATVTLRITADAAADRSAVAPSAGATQIPVILTHAGVQGRFTAYISSPSSSP